MLAIPLLTDITLTLNSLQTKNKSSNDHTLVYFVFVSVDLLLHFFRKFTHDNKRTYFENSKEADDFLLSLPTSTVVPLNNIFDDTSLNDIMYMKYKGLTLG